VTLEVNGEPVPLAPGLELNAYRIIQEALTNSLKHGHATSGRVCISYFSAALELEIVDNGHNLGSEDGFTGQGLIGMRERVLLHGGQLEVAPQDPQGFRVWVRLPYQSSP
jgi:signal transduction histidine kinase